jgi:hypothetical protein
VLELIGVVLLATSVATVAVVSKRFLLPNEIRSPAPAHFELPPMESYNRLFTLLSAGWIGSHTWQVIETVAPLYIVAELCYSDETGRKCDLLVTFDVVETANSTTTVRWSGKFLRTCDRQIAGKMEKLLDSWIQTCLIASLEVPPSAMHSRLLDPVEIDASMRAPESRGAKALTDVIVPVKELIAKNIPIPPTRSPDAMHFDIALADAYKRVHEVLMRPESYGYKWSIKDSVADAYIVAQLNFKDKRNLVPSKCTVNLDFKETSTDSISIVWSCEFTKWNDDASIDRVIDAINVWLNTALLPSKEQSSFALYIPPSLEIPILSTLKSGYPKEFAYRKLLPKLSGTNGPNTSWKIIECHQSSNISARVEHRSLKEPETKCVADVCLDFMEHPGGCEIKVVYQFTPDSDLYIFESFQRLTDEWMQLVLKR